MFLKALLGTDWKSWFRNSGSKRFGSETPVGILRIAGPRSKTLGDS